MKYHICYSQKKSRNKVRSKEYCCHASQSGVLPFGFFHMARSFVDFFDNLRPNFFIGIRTDILTAQHILGWVGQTNARRWRNDLKSANVASVGSVLSLDAKWAELKQNLFQFVFQQKNYYGILFLWIQTFQEFFLYVQEIIFPHDRESPPYCPLTAICLSSIFL